MRKKPQQIINFNITNLAHFLPFLDQDLLVLVLDQDWAEIISIELIEWQCHTNASYDDEKTKSIGIQRKIPSAN